MIRVSANIAPSHYCNQVVSGIALLSKSEDFNTIALIKASLKSAVFSVLY